MPRGAGAPGLGSNAGLGAGLGKCRARKNRTEKTAMKTRD